MLGFGAIGVNPVGIGPRSSVTITVFLTSTVTAICSLRGENSPVSALAGRLTGISKARPPMSPIGVMSAKVGAMLRARAPGGLILKSRITAMAKANVSPGYLLFAKVAMNSSAMSDIHIEGKMSGPRDPLLLNSSSQFGASYWKGRS